MIALEIIRMALRALLRHRGRSLLTALGIIVGTAAVVVVVALGTGARERIEKEVSKIGNHLLFIFSVSGARSGARISPLSLTEGDAAAIRTQASAAGAVTVWSQVRTRVHSDLETHRTAVMGIDRWYFEVRGFSVKDGREIGEFDERTGAKVAIVGKTVAQELFPDQDALGRNLRIGRQIFEIVGVLAEKGRSSFEDQDDRILLPMKTFRSRVAPGSGRYVQLVMVSAKTSAHTERALEQSASILRSRHRLAPGDPDDFLIRSQAGFKEAQDEMLDLVTLLLTSAALIALFVGGVGVMNIMMVGVAERTREIGLKMAVGARPLEILFQFLLEAVVLSSFGGAVGVFLSAGVAWTLGALLDWSVELDPVAVLIAMGTSMAVGVLFGAVPARRAANMDPIDALRST